MLDGAVIGPEAFLLSAGAGLDVFEKEPPTSSE